MNCKICLKVVEPPSENTDYHSTCLKRLFGTVVSPQLTVSKKQFEESVPKYVARVSISGIQQKLPACVKNNQITLTSVGGTHILKPAPNRYPGICENEHVSMRIAALLGIEVAECGLVSFSDGELTYVVKRFDREEDRKISQEDMAQILGRQRDDEQLFKYKGSYEEVGKAIFTATGKPAVVLRFIERLIFNYLIANGDYHLKNISLQFLDSESRYRQLTPLYDSVNTRIHIPNEERDLALEDLFSDGSFTPKYEQYGYHTGYDFIELAKRIDIPEKSVNYIYDRIKTKKDDIFALVNASYLSPENKSAYCEQLQGRFSRLFERP